MHQPLHRSQQMREGGERDARLLDIVSFRGWCGVNMLLTVLVFIHIDVVLLYVPELIFPHLLNVISPLSYKALDSGYTAFGEH